MEIEFTIPPPSCSAIRCTNNCAAVPFQKNSLGVAYIVRRLLRHGSLARYYQRRCPTLSPLRRRCFCSRMPVPLAFATVFKPQNVSANCSPGEGTICIPSLLSMLENPQSISIRRWWGSDPWHLRLADQLSDALTTVPQRHSQRRMVWALTALAWA